MIKVLFYGFSLLLPIFLYAENKPILEVAKVDSWHISASLGYGQMISPLTNKSDISLYLLPDIRYFGEKIYIENTTINYSLKETPTFSFDLVGLLNQDGLYFPHKYRDVIASVVPTTGHGIRPLPGFDLGNIEEAIIYPDKKNYSYMVGGALKYFGTVNINFVATADISAGHHGRELHLNMKKSFKLGSLNVEPKIGASFKSKELVDYYYGIDGFNTSTDFVHLSYKPSSAINWHFQIQFAYTLAKNYWLVSSYRIDNNDSEITNSPIVNKDSFQSYFFGIKGML